MSGVLSCFVVAIVFVLPLSCCCLVLPSPVLVGPDFVFVFVLVVCHLEKDSFFDTAFSFISATWGGDKEGRLDACLVLPCLAIVVFNTGFLVSE